ncbi:MAG: amidophosphoribosyltransferase [Ponticaulis sp.]|nr:amidophosphoribosyltransferase [Ponticaulis sp.]
MARSGLSAKLPLPDRERLRQIFGWLAPGQSLISGQALWGNARFTVDEFLQLQHLTAPYCDQCALPFDRLEDAGQICAACAAEHPGWSKARSAFVYDDTTSQMVLGLKRSGKRAGLRVLGRYMTDAAREILDTADVLIPVPVHYRRLAVRGFNQAGWLAEAISDQTGIPVHHQLLARVKATPSQGHLTSRQRRKNVAGAFRLTEKGRNKLTARRLVLVDDVYTTGATLNACARALHKAKPANLDVVTLARVVAPRNPLI